MKNSKKIIIILFCAMWYFCSCSEETGYKVLSKEPEDEIEGGSASNYFQGEQPEDSEEEPDESAFIPEDSENTQDSTYNYPVFIDPTSFENIPLGEINGLPPGPKALMTLLRHSRGLPKCFENGRKWELSSIPTVGREMIMHSFIRMIRRLR